MTDQELKLKLAEMLPEKIKVNAWNNYQWTGKDGYDILETEWLHVCWLVEQTFVRKDIVKEGQYLKLIQEEATDCWGDSLFIYTVHASWQQRAEALCKVKGNET